MRLRPVGLGLALLAAAAALPGHAQDCRVSHPRPANAYFEDEAVRMTVEMPAPQRRVAYRIVDYYGAVRTYGNLFVGGVQPVVLDMGRRPGVGYYRLTLTWNGGSHEEPFCVLPRPYDDPGEYALFGLCPNNGSTDENLQVAAQMGVRVVRQTVPWPPLEPARGDWRMELLDNWHDIASRHGIQMMLILGYTPGFVAERPINYLDDWVRAATFTWHVTEPNEYGLYLDRVTSFAQDKTISWPPAAVLAPTGAPPRQQLPWTHSWEMWNEADHCFYVGDWNRYMDLLRMSWAAGRRRVPSAPMVYGGSTGNWVAMGMAASGSPRYAFDYVGLHTGGDVEEALRIWYSGAQQIPWCVGAPRETSHTECYAQGRRGTVDYRLYQETPGELQRCYLTLKAWREGAFYRSGCLGGYIYEEGAMAPGTSLLVPRNGKLEPTPLYPAFAAARKLISDAVEVGPLDLGPNITANLFLKHGRPVLTAWSDDGATATIRLAPSAHRIDPFGRMIYLPGSSLTTRLGVEPLVIHGPHSLDYLPEAFRERYRLLSRTPYGTTQTNSACFVWYARPMADDLQDLLGSQPMATLDRVIERAAQGLRSWSPNGVLSILAAQDICFEISKQLIATCRPGQEIPVKVANNLWRLARMEEWLSEIADDYGVWWPQTQLPPTHTEPAVRALRHARANVRSRHGAATVPLAEQLLDRADWRLWRLSQYHRKGTYNALWHRAQIVERLNQVEKGVVLRVVPILDFSTGLPFRKARVMEPGRTQTMHLWAYNYLDHPVRGTLRLSLPACWSPRELEVPFAAEPGQPSEMRPVQVTLPRAPEPWIKASSFTMDGFINVTLPSTMSDRPAIELGGALSTGEELSPMVYQVNVGQWTDQPEQVSLQARAMGAAANTGLQLPPGVKQAQVSAALRELQSLSERYPRETQTRAGR